MEKKANVVLFIFLFGDTKFKDINLKIRICDLEMHFWEKHWYITKIQEIGNLLRKFDTRKKEKQKFSKNILNKLFCKTVSFTCLLCKILFKADSHSWPYFQLWFYLSLFYDKLFLVWLIMTGHQICDKILFFQMYRKGFMEFNYTTNTKLV